MTTHKWDLQGAKQECITHDAKPTLNNTPDCIIIHCGTNNWKMVSDSSKVVISSILTLRVYLEAKIRKFIKIIQNLFHEDETLTFLDQKSPDIGKRIAKDRWQWNRSIFQRVKNLMNFYVTDNNLLFGTSHQWSILEADHLKKC